MDNLIREAYLRWAQTMQDLHTIHGITRCELLRMGATMDIYGGVTPSYKTCTAVEMVCKHLREPEEA